MSLTTFVKNGDIFNCELKLANGEMFTIPMREDGYIYATALCKASGKRLALWKVNKETNEFFDKVKADVGIPTSALIEICKALSFSKKIGDCKKRVRISLTTSCSARLVSL